MKGTGNETPLDVFEKLTTRVLTLEERALVMKTKQIIGLAHNEDISIEEMEKRSNEWATKTRALKEQTPNWDRYFLIHTLAGSTPGTYSSYLDVNTPENIISLVERWTREFT